jgi:D-3-phosphoglycerate dehydrogenase / 2-oxoglutarate reductase
MRLLIISRIDQAAAARLRRTHDVIDAVGASPAELKPLIADREVLIFRSGVEVSADLLQHAPELRLIVRGGSGYDNVDLDYLERHGIEFVRVPEPGARAVAELAFGLMLTLARDIPRADRTWRQGRWLKHELSGVLLRGRVLGIVGAGNIGRQVGELGALWGMNVIGCVGRPGPAVAVELRQRGIRLADFDEVVRTADFLCVHVGLTDATRNLIDGDVLARMKPGSFLLNLARGGVVDEAALRAALVRGDRLKGAALDVHAAEGEGRISPLADLPNVVLTPHIGSTTVDTQREIGERIVDIIDRAVAARSAMLEAVMDVAVAPRAAALETVS